MTELSYRPCVGVMLINPDGLVFAGERTDTPDAWQMPQGGIDRDEEPRAAALRELWEETGVPETHVDIEAETADWVDYDFPPDIVARVAKGRFRGQRQKWYRMRLLGPDSLIDITRVPREFSRWRWMTPDDLIRAIVPFKRDVYAQVFAELA